MLTNPAHSETPLNVFTGRQVVVVAVEHGVPLCPSNSATWASVAKVGRRP